ncbi:MAG: APC family permease [Lachnospiraceae bacterium]|nr:APC family permease [Lachnospiraceae bacterium]
MKKISVFGAVSTGVGMLIATSCFISSASGASQVGTPFIAAILIACAANMMAVLSIAELNAIMPNLTGGIAQYTLAGMGPMITIITMVGGYLISNVFAAPAEGAMFGNVMVDITGGKIPSAVFSVGITIILVVVNLMGVNMSTFLQEIVATFMVVVLFFLGFVGAFGMGSGEEVAQNAVLSASMKDVMPLTATAFWFFIGAEFIVPLGKDMKHPKQVPLSMFLSLAIMCVIQILMVLGYRRYTPWKELGDAVSPHMLYAVHMLGEPGRYLMVFIAIFAAVSTQNSILGSVAEICCGMSKMGLLPEFFSRKNSHEAPWAVLLILGFLTCLIEASGISTGEQVSFLTLTCSLFWMLSYITSHINVILLRVRMKKVPRNYKTPFFPTFQIVGIALQMYMMLHISTDPVQKAGIYRLCLILFIGLFIYAFIWVKRKMKVPFFRGMGVHRVIAMESPEYHRVREMLRAESEKS